MPARSCVRLKALLAMRTDILVVAALGTLLLGLESATDLVLRLLSWGLRGGNQAATVWIDCLLLLALAATALVLRRLRELRAEVARRRQAEAALVESEARFRRLIELSPDAALVHADGEIRLVNAAGLELLGARTPALVAGRRLDEFVRRGDQALLQPQPGSARAALRAS